MKSSHGSERDPMASRFEFSRVGMRGLVGTCVRNDEISQSDGTLCGGTRDSVHYSRHYSLAEEVLALVWHERAARSGERQCCSAVYGSWRAPTVSGLRCSLKLRHVVSRMQSRHVHHAAVEDSSQRLEQTHWESDESSRDALRHRTRPHYAVSLQIENGCERIAGHRGIAAGPVQRLCALTHGLEDPALDAGLPD
jgi:hypothetical protein